MVDTELIRVNFVREESEPWSRASERGREAERRQLCGPTTASGCDSCACPESDVRCLSGGFLFFSLFLPRATLAPTSVGWSRKRISTPFRSVRINALA